MDQTFPNNWQRAHLKQLAKWRHLYDGEHYRVFGIKDYFVDDTKKERQLYIAANMPALITEYFGDLMVGEGVDFVIDDETTKEKLDEITSRNNLNELIYQMSLDQSTFGYSVLRVRPDLQDSSKAVIEMVQPDIYYPSFEMNGELMKVCLASYINDPLSTEKNGLLYKTIYEKMLDTVTIRYEVRTVKADQGEGDLVDPRRYQTFFPETSLPPQTIEGITRIPVWQINNTKRAYEMYGKSDYKDIEPQLEELNNRITHISIQLIKHMNARMAVPSQSLPDGGEVKVKDIDFFEVEKDDITPTYITNSNPLIDSAFKFMDMLMKQALGIAKVPPEMVLLESSSGNEKVEAMRIRLFPSLRKVARKRINFERPLNEALKYALSIEGTQTESNIRIVWDDILPVDMNALVTQLVQRKTAGLVSARTAIEQMDSLSSQEADLELERIRQEEPKIEPFNPII